MKKNSLYVCRSILFCIIFYGADVFAQNICLLPINSCSPAPCSYRVLSTGLRVEPLITSLPVQLTPPEDTCLGPVIKSTTISFKTLPLVQAPLRNVASEGSEHGSGENSMNSFLPSWVVSVSDINNIPSSVTYQYSQWQIKNDSDPAVNCAGAWSACDATNKKTYTILQPATGGGVACPFANGAVDSCTPADTCVIEKTVGGVITTYSAGDLEFETFKHYFSNPDKDWVEDSDDGAVRMKSGGVTSAWGHLYYSQPYTKRPANVGTCSFTPPPAYAPGTCLIRESECNETCNYYLRAKILPLNSTVKVRNFSPPLPALNYTSTCSSFDNTSLCVFGPLDASGFQDVQCVSSSLPTAKCGSAANGTTGVAPVANLCDVGSASAVMGSGPWNWTCTDSAPSAVACESN